MDSKKQETAERPKYTVSRLRRGRSKYLVAHDLPRLQLPGGPENDNDVPDGAA